MLFLAVANTVPGTFEGTTNTVAALLLLTEFAMWSAAGDLIVRPVVGVPGGEMREGAFRGTVGGGRLPAGLFRASH
jgi:hypothetical protein